jgi:hypothetical protein
MKIFISHISEETKIANVLKDWIESTFSSSCSVFVSSNAADIPPGSKWLDQIDQALSETAILLIICSRKSISRPWINFEAGCGWIKRIPVVPLCHSGILKSSLPQPLAMLQGLDIESEAFTCDLINSISSYLKIIKVPRIAHSEFRADIQDSIASINQSESQDFEPSQVNIKTEINYNEKDIIAIMKSWMGARPADHNKRVIHFTEVDKEHNFSPGTTKKYIKQVAMEWGYIVDHEGEATILFKEKPRSNSVGVARSRWM